MNPDPERPRAASRRHRPRLPRLAGGGRGRWIAALVGLAFLRAGLGVGTAILLRAVWRGATLGTPHGAGSVVVLFLLCGWGDYGLRILEGLSGEILGQRYVRVVRRRWFSLALFVPGPGSRGGAERSPAWHATLVQDLAMLKNWVSTGFARALSGATLLGCVGCVLAVSRPRAAVALAVLALPVLAWGRFAARRLAVADRQTRRQRGRLARFVTERLDARAATRAFGCERREVRALRTVSDRLAALQVRRARRRVALRHLPEPFVPMALAALAGAGFGGEPAVAMEGGALVLLASLAAGALRDLSRAWEQKVLFDSARRRLNRMARRSAGILDAHPGSSSEDADAGKTALPDPLPVLSLHDVAAGDRFEGVSVDLAPAGRAVLTGPGGAGKTTLLRMIAGFTPPESGSVRVAGHGPARWTGRRRARRVQWVSGEVPLRAGSVRDNLAYGRSRRDRDPAWLDTVAGWCGIDADPAAFPQGAATAVGPGGAGLSSGARARVTLARAAVVRPKLLLIDDPAFLIDPAAQAALRRVLDELGAATVTVGAAGGNPVGATELWTLSDRRLTTSAMASEPDGGAGGGRLRQVPCSTSSAASS